MLWVERRTNASLWHEGTGMKGVHGHVEFTADCWVAAGHVGSGRVIPGFFCWAGFGKRFTLHGLVFVPLLERLARVVREVQRVIPFTDAGQCTLEINSKH